MTTERKTNSLLSLAKKFDIFKGWHKESSLYREIYTRTLGGLGALAVSGVAVGIAAWAKSLTVPEVDDSLNFVDIIFLALFVLGLGTSLFGLITGSGRQVRILFGCFAIVFLVTSLVLIF